MAIDYQPLSNTSLSFQVAEKIRDAILQGGLKADDRLPTEDELAQRFNVSRPTVREALKRLAAQNLVRSKRGPTGGTFVNRPTPADLSEGLTSAMMLMLSSGEFDLPEVDLARRELEILCCRLGATLRSEAQLEVMERELSMQRQADLSPEAFCASDVRFHRAMADATQNGVLRFVMFAVIEALQPVANMIAYRFRERTVIIDQHNRLLDAFRSRNPDTAVATLTEQLDYLHQQQMKARRE